jgi:hypothetical protein
MIKIVILIIIVISIFLLRNEHENFSNIDIINEVFSESFMSVKADKEKYDNNITYGEISNEGIEILSNLTQNKNLFIDLGCGTGRSLAYAIFNGFNKAKGVELVLERVEYAKKQIELLPSHIKDNIEIKQDDILKLNKDYFLGANVIWISNLLFPVKINDKIFKLLSDNIEKNTIVVVSYMLIKTYDLKFIKEIIVPMSWDKNSVVKIFMKV